MVATPAEFAPSQPLDTRYRHVIGELARALCARPDMPQRARESVRVVVSDDAERTEFVWLDFGDA